MKIKFLILFLILGFTAIGQVRPDQMPEKEPALDDACYTQEDGGLKKVKFSKLKTFFSPDIVTAFVAPPAFDANSQYKGKVVIVDQDVYYVDGTGKGYRIEEGGIVGTDDQQLTTFSMDNNNRLTLTLEDGGTKIVEINQQHISQSGDSLILENGGYIKTGYITVVADGQSNSIGQEPDSAPTSISAPNIKVWDSGWKHPVLGQPPFNQNGANNIGVRFAEELARENPLKTVKYIQLGNNGMPISYWIGGNKQGLVTFDSLLNVASIGEIDYLIWDQGESDYASNHYVEDYYTHVTNMKSTGHVGNNTIIINIGLYEGPGNIYGALNSTIKVIGRDTNTTTISVNTDGFSTIDNIHWTNQSIDKIAEKVYNSSRAAPYVYFPDSVFTLVADNYAILLGNNNNIESTSSFRLTRQSLFNILELNGGQAGMGGTAIRFFREDTMIGAMGVYTTFFGGTGKGILTYTWGERPIDFATNGALRLRIASNGNIGVGVNTPTEKLHVNGNLKVNRIKDSANNLGQPNQVLSMTQPVDGNTEPALKWVDRWEKDYFVGASWNTYDVYETAGAGVSISGDTYPVNKMKWVKNTAATDGTLTISGATIDGSTDAITLPANSTVQLLKTGATTWITL